ncbi:MAG: hypothetical protein JWN40_1264 [Phycisphaerales bacterium]|nr:hypothetical protein [Phycisphaerales bacterium]
MLSYEIREDFLQAVEGRLRLKFFDGPLLAECDQRQQLVVLRLIQELFAFGEILHVTRQV